MLNYLVSFLLPVKPTLAPFSMVPFVTNYTVPKYLPTKLKLLLKLIPVICSITHAAFPRIAKIVPATMRIMAEINLRNGTSCNKAPAVRNINKPIQYK